VMPSIPQTSPADLRSLRGWLVWKFEPGVKGKKPRKVPYYANGYRRYADHGTPEDRSQLVPFDVALKIARQRGYDGVGLALLDGFNVTALDFDNCVDADGNVNPEVEKLVAGTYAELSPSGTGVRAFFHGELGNGKSHDGPYGFESFSTAGFVTYTGNTLDVCDLLDSGDTVAELPEDVRQLYQQRVGERRKHDADPLMTYEPTLELSERQLLELLDGLDPDVGYEDWLRVGMALHHETGGERFDLWDEWSQGSEDKYPGTESLRKHWDSFDDTGTVVTARSLLKMSTAHVNPELATADDFDDVSGEAEANPEKPPRFQVVPAADFSGVADKGWYVKGVLPRAELAVLYGESGSGKTFAVLDLAMAVARGVAWRGLRVKQGRVVYVAAEGGGGFRKRLKAYAQHQGIDLAEVPFGVIHAAPNMLAKTDALDVAKAIKAFGGADLVIVDTFAQVTPGGNENSGEDVGLALTHLKGIHRASGALVLLVHHSGKDASKGARGWSGLRAAVDVELEVFKLAGQR
ncbi:MAG: AAA family ATPase, partial [Ramlibacter sp.]|nr:AAA family ATPase [Ramlibacter sp.]